jgi:hypothetical protein
MKRGWIRQLCFARASQELMPEDKSSCKKDSSGCYVADAGFAVAITAE